MLQRAAATPQAATCRLRKRSGKHATLVAICYDHKRTTTEETIVPTLGGSTYSWVTK